MAIFEISLFGITFAPRWYALMYIIGFIAGWVFLKKNIKWKQKDDLDILFFYVGLGVIFGGRIGYVLFYNLVYYTSHPLKILAFWEGGMSFHGGFIGVLIAVLLYSYKYKYKFWYLIDRIAVIVPVGLGFGRIGNYINNELYGYSPYNGPFAMMVNNIPHFPSPLLEMLLEGIVLFSVLFFLYKKTNHKNFPGKLSGVFLIGYSLGRIFVEFFRLPDANIGYLLGTNFLTLGMIYSLPMLFFGIYLLTKKQTLHKG